MKKSRPIVMFPEPALRKRIDDFRLESGMPYAEIARRAVDQYLESKERCDTHKRKDQHAIRP